MTTSSSNRKLEALARARAWRDQRCATPTKRVKKTASESEEGFINESPRRVLARIPTHAGATLVTRTPKDEAKDRALARAREFAARLKEKKEQPKEGNGIPAAINIEDDTLSNLTPIPSLYERDMSAAKMEGIKRITAEMKKLSERLEAVTK